MKSVTEPKLDFPATIQVESHLSNRSIDSDRNLRFTSFTLPSQRLSSRSFVFVPCGRSLFLRRRCYVLDAFLGTSVAAGVYPDRVAGGHCDHRGAGCAALARSAAGA